MFNRDLSYNQFDNLPIPNSGWPHLRRLYLQDVYSLYEAPTPDDIPELEKGLFTYSYHCCAFESRIQAENNTTVRGSSVYPEPVIPVIEIDVETFTPSPPIEEANITYLCEFFKDLALPICHHDDGDDNDDPPQPFIDNFNGTEIVFVTRKERHIPKESSLFLCHPYSDEPMTPCKNLLGYWVLRILVWLLFIFIMVGNGVVLMLILKSACGMKDWKIPHLLLLFQLTMADIGVGVYLGFLAAVDLKTFSQNNFYQLALSWQHGPCLAAGFIAIFSLELSIYTLMIIVLERVYVHTYTLQHVKMCYVISIALIGWLFAAICASLPLIGYNSYSSVAICLPLDVVSISGRYYIAILMGTNLLIFLMLSGCNLYIYCRIRWTNTTTLNRKMFLMVAMLVLVDYLCWAPLVMVSLAALSNRDLINTNITKWFAVLVLPINACAKPFIYVLLTEKCRQQVLRIKRAALSCQQNKNQLQPRNSEELGKPSCDCVELTHQIPSDSLSNEQSKNTVLNENVLSESPPSVTNPMFKDYACNISMESPLHDTGEVDSTSITSFSISAVSTATDNDDVHDDYHRLISAKLNTEVAIEETDT